MEIPEIDFLNGSFLRRRKSVWKFEYMEEDGNHHPAAAKI